MKMKSKITKDNFLISSIADFKKVDNAPDREPDYVSYQTFIVWEHKVEFVDIDNEGDQIVGLEDYDEDDNMFFRHYKVIDRFLGKYGDIGYKCQSEYVSSRYWYTEEGVYRKSNHWGKCRNCHWTIDGEEINSHEDIVGFCKWEDFTNEVIDFN